MDKKILTIGIPAYNMEEYLERCLESVVDCNNLYKIEIIIVNDGSRDKTSEIAHQYETKYPGSVRVIDKENGGWGTAINRSIKEATAKYYKSLDSDDWFITENLDKFIEELDKTEADLILTDFNEINEYNDIRTVQINGHINETVSLEKHLIKINKQISPIHAITYRTTFLKDLNFKVEPKFYADIDYVLSPFCHIQSVHVMPLNIYQYFRGREGQSVSIEGYNAHFMDFITVTKKLIPLAENKSSDSTILNTILSDNISKFVIFAYKLLMMNKYQRKNKVSKHLLKELDQYLKNTSLELYKIVGKKRAFKILPYIKLWRITGFNIFTLVRI